MRRYAENIQWDYDEDEPYEALKDMSIEKAASLLDIPVRIYANMHDDERYDYAHDAFHHCPALADEVLNLPDEVEIPDELTEDEDIAEYISDKYGFCIAGFDITDKMYFGSAIIEELRYGNVEDFRKLAKGDTIRVKGYIETMTVLNAPFYNNDCDEPEWEVETNCFTISIWNDITRIRQRTA